MRQGSQRRKTLPRARDYEKFRDQIEKILRQARQPLTWTEIKEKAGFKQKVPNNKWVKWREREIGLVRERTKEGKTFWQLGEPA